MSSTAFIDPLPVIEFVNQLLNKDVSARPLSDADRIKVRFLVLHNQMHLSPYIISLNVPKLLHWKCQQACLVEFFERVVFICLVCIIDLM